MCEEERKITITSREEEKIKEIKKIFEKRTIIPASRQRLSPQGKNLDAEASMEINDIKDATRVEVSSRL